MKIKNLTLAALTLIALASCRKDRTCECTTETKQVKTTTSSQFPGSSVETYNYSSTNTDVIKKVRKKYINSTGVCVSTTEDLADTDVNSNSTTVTTGTRTRTCKLK